MTEEKRGREEKRARESATAASDATGGTARGGGGDLALLQDPQPYSNLALAHSFWDVELENFDVKAPICGLAGVPLLSLHDL